MIHVYYVHLDSFADKLNKLSHRTIKNPAKICKTHERNLINIKATDKFSSLNNFVLISEIKQCFKLHEIKELYQKHPLA